VLPTNIAAEFQPGVKLRNVCCVGLLAGNQKAIPERVLAKPPDGGEVVPAGFAPAFLQSFNERVERILGELLG